MLEMRGSGGSRTPIWYEGPPIREKHESLGGPAFFCTDVITLPLFASFAACEATLVRLC